VTSVVTSAAALEGGPSAPRARPRRVLPAWAGSPVAAAVLAAGLAWVAARLGWRGSDTANHLFRADLFRRAGFAVWTNAWYGGVHVPGYSVLLPPLSAALGPALAGGAAAAVAAWCFGALVRSCPGVTPRRALAGSLLFAAGTVTNLAVGRLAFALGLALGLAALLAARRGRRGLAAVITPVTALASPLAGGFLAIGWLGAATAARERARLPVFVGLAALAVAPTAVLALLFPEGGRFPFRGGALVAVLLISVGTIVLVPAARREVRVAAVIYALVALAAFVVPNPVGGNLVRLGMFAAGPLLVALADRRRALVLALLPLLLWWQWSPALDGMLRSGADPATRAAYYAPLIQYLSGRRPPLGRIEIPFTERHFEAVYVAPVASLARGWERQVDMDVNSLFYEERLDPEAYHRWLLDNGVELVALPDAQLDPSARQEAAIVRQAPGFLRPVWSGGHWRVWEVVGATGLVSGSARLVREADDTVEVQAFAPGDVVVRVRWNDYWAVDGPACVALGPDGWVHLDVHQPGRMVLHPVLFGERSRCPP
jgi:hypothetical protein